MLLDLFIQLRSGQNDDEVCAWVKDETSDR